MTVRAQVNHESLSDRDLALGIARRDPVVVRLVTQRNNQRLFRIAFGILKSRPESEDAVQSAYLKGFAAIESFRGASSLSTWLTRIVINEALERRRTALRGAARMESSIIMLDDYREKLAGGSRLPTPEEATARDQIRMLIERAVARLPEDFRLVFILREIEGASIADTADLLELPPATVKTRHLRARRRLQAALGPELRMALHGSFPFAGVACADLSERIVEQFCPSREP
jgi:RNA polymerase sigma-70 factor (ECF subfamily)